MTVDTALPPFPPPSAGPPTLPAAAGLHGLSLRAARAEDLPFLSGLYARFRTWEMAQAPWPAEQKRAFLADQFRLQHLHFVRVYAAADFWILARGGGEAGEPVGRLYLDRSGPVWRIVDIGLVPEARGKGTGGALIAWVGDQAVAAGADVTLQVALNNPRARALYLRLGFEDDGGPGGMHQPMIRRSAGARGETRRGGAPDGAARRSGQGG